MSTYGASQANDVSCLNSGTTLTQKEGTARRNFPRDPGVSSADLYGYQYEKFDRAMSFRSEQDPKAKYNGASIPDGCIDHTYWYVWYG
jgi:hypothetical protein